ncbi:MAG: hypothetical protein U0531_20370 [Dehalococcoidia bacterium]
MAGLYRPTAGRITFGGRRIDGLKPHQITRARHRPHLPEHPPVRGAMSALDNILVGMHCRPTTGAARRHGRWPAVLREEASARGTGARPARLHRPGRQVRTSGRGPRLRRPAPAGVGARPRHRAAPAAAR